MAEGNVTSRRLAPDALADLGKLPQRARAAVMLACGIPVARVAQEVSVSRETIWRWRSQDAEFRELFDAVQREITDRAVASAFATLVELMEPEHAGRERCQAAAIILTHAGRMRRETNARG
jgi:transposase-like protein